jgi:hypothetical protein
MEGLGRHLLSFDRQGRANLASQFQIVHYQILDRSVEALAATDGHVHAASGGMNAREMQAIELPAPPEASRTTQ